MTGLVILGLYLVGWAFTAVFLGRAFQQVDQARRGVEWAERYRWMNLAQGAAAGMLWPLALSCALVYYALRGPARALMMTPLDREHAQRLELDRLRAQARALGLPYPGEDR